jgi:hypothetical protein
MAPHGATKTSPYELVYGHHVVLPWEAQSDSRRIVLQKDLNSKDYSGLMMDELEDLHMIRLRALENMEKNKLQIWHVKSVLTQNLHLTPSTQQAEKSWIHTRRNHKTCQSIFPEN